MRNLIFTSVLLTATLCAAVKKTDSTFEPSVPVIASADDILAVLEETQQMFVLMAPPSMDEVYLQPAGTFYLDEKKFGSLLTDKLLGEWDGKVPVFEVMVLKDPDTRDVLIMNRDGAVLQLFPGDAKEDPYAWVDFSNWSDLRLERFISDPWQQWIYDPARVAVSMKLIPLSYQSDYEQQLEDLTI